MIFKSDLFSVVYISSFFLYVSWSLDEYLVIECHENISRSLHCISWPWLNSKCNWVSKSSYIWQSV